MNRSTGPDGTRTPTGPVPQGKDRAGGCAGLRPSAASMGSPVEVEWYRGRLRVEAPAGGAAGKVAVGECDDRDRPDGVGAVDRRVLELRRHTSLVLGVHRRDEAGD